MLAKRPRCSSGRSCLAFLALGLVAGAARADLPEVVFEITARAGSVSATIPILADWGVYDPESQTWSFELPDGLKFMGGSGQDTCLGTLSELGITVVEDPQINLNFAAQAGSSDTEFFIASSLLTFTTIDDPYARASLALTLTDNNFDGAMMAGSYLGQYNGWAGNPQGPDGETLFEFFFDLAAGPGETATEVFNWPESGWAPIPEPAESMSVLINFELSAWDSASGTSTLVIIPEPPALALLGLTTLALARRRS